MCNPVCEICCVESKPFFEDSNSDRFFYICPDCYIIFEKKEHKKISFQKEAEFFKNQWKRNPDGGYSEIYPYVKTLVETCSKSKLSILDFGCGNGGLIRYFRGLGIETFGLDNVPVVNDMEPFVRKDIDELPNKKFDVITGIEVLEHLSNPLETLNKLESLLVDDGFMFFTTAITNRSMANLRYFSHWIYRMDDTHVSFYHEKTVNKLAKLMKLDLKVIKNDFIVFDRRFDRVIMPYRDHFGFAAEEKNSPNWPINLDSPNLT